MADSAPIFVTRASGHIGAVGRAVTGLFLERELAIRATHLPASLVRFTERSPG